jgi:hypothetical protein
MSNILRKSRIIPKFKSRQSDRAVDPALRLLKLWNSSLTLARIRVDGISMSLNGRKPESDIRETTAKQPDFQSGRFLPNQQPLRKYRIKNVAEIDVLSDPKVLLIDFDFAQPLPRIFPILSRLRTIGVQVKRIRFSRTKKGWHLEIGITIKLTKAETVAAQAILGSDLRREAMNLRRAISLRVHKHSRFWRKRWNILFLRKL